MSVDRWIVPPAVAAAVFTTVAIVPPGGPPARGLRVELLGTPSANRPCLVRVSIEDAGTPRWRAPSVARGEIRDARGAASALHFVASPGEPFAFGAATPAGPGPYTLRTWAEGYVASTTLPAERSEARAGAPPTDAVGEIDVRVESGALVPEVPATLLLAARQSAGHRMRVRPEDPSLSVRPMDLSLDACGLAATQIELRGLEARVTLELAGSEPRTLSRALPVAPGGLRVQGTPARAEIDGPVGGQPVFLISGDLRGPIHWSVERLVESADRPAHAALALPTGALWLAASFSPMWDAPAIAWLGLPAGTGACETTPLGVRYARARLLPPTIPRVRLVHDGAAQALIAREGRKTRARRIALACAVLALTILAALVLAAGLRPTPASVRGLALPARGRIWLALAGVGTIVIAGFVLLTAYVLRI